MPSGIVRSIPFKIIDYFDVSPVTGTSLFLTVVTIHKLTLTLEPFLGQSLSTFQYCYSVNLFLENTGEGDFTTGEGDFFVFSGRIHKGKEKKKRID